MTAISTPPMVNFVPDSLPWVDVGEGIELKVLQVDIPNGVWTVRNRFQPGATVQTHKHTGCVYGFTLSGSWQYAEYSIPYPAGTYIFEPAGSIHTLIVPEDAPEPADAIFVINGANLNLDENGNVVSIIDARFILDVYYGFCEALGLGHPEGVLVS